VVTVLTCRTETGPATSKKKRTRKKKTAQQLKKLERKALKKASMSWKEAHRNASKRIARCAQFEERRRRYTAKLKNEERQRQ
jgi:hypothetical protein